MVRETSQWEREEMEKVVSEAENVSVRCRNIISTCTILQGGALRGRFVCYGVNEASPLHPCI